MIDMAVQRDLTVKAALAAGHEIGDYDLKNEFEFLGLYINPKTVPGGLPWAPLRDDGQALQLGVRLSIMFNGSLRLAYQKYLDQHDMRPSEAMRYAIVDVAARMPAKTIT